MLHLVNINIILNQCIAISNIMRVEETHIKNCFIIHDSYINDSRGYFFESFNKNTFYEKTKLKIDFVQDNQSNSEKGVLRGLHFQKGKFAQAKLVRVIHGTVLDIAVDLRKNSKTFGKYVSVELSDHSRTQFFIPRGFAHGFIVLSNQATLLYKCDNYYNKESEGGIIYNDADLNINWKFSENEIKLSEKDIKLPKLKDSFDSLIFK
jgi:dTDP-4-dehydrorhamnose 3,5-epimerase